MATDDYSEGFRDGIHVAVSLARAGATADELAGLLPQDPGRVDPGQYQTRLQELRRILGTDGPC